MLPKLIVLIGLLQGLDGGVINFSQSLQDGCKKEARQKKEKSAQPAALWLMRPATQGAKAALTPEPFGSPSITPLALCTLQDKSLAS